MSDQTPRTPPSSPPVADLINLEADIYGRKDGEPVVRLRLQVERSDPLEFRKRARWDLLIGRDDLAEIAEKLQQVLQE